MKEKKRNRKNTDFFTRKKIFKTPNPCNHNIVMYLLYLSCIYQIMRNVHIHVEPLQNINFSIETAFHPSMELWIHVEELAMALHVFFLAVDNLQKHVQVIFFTLILQLASRIALTSQFY